jgi:hypothetical protein
MAQMLESIISHCRAALFGSAVLLRRVCRGPFLSKRHNIAEKAAQKRIHIGNQHILSDRRVFAYLQRIQCYQFRVLLKDAAVVIICGLPDHVA